jgi:fructoselysine and glucoselysine-specific PTS system IID component
MKTSDYENQDATDSPELTKKDLRRLFWRSFQMEFS